MQDDYIRSASCGGEPARALHEQCTTFIGATVAHAELSFAPNGAPHPRVTLRQVSEFTVGTLVVEVAQPVPAFFKVREGDPITVKVWNGRPRTLYVTSKSAIALIDNPLVGGSVLMTGGLSLIAVGGLIMVLVLPTSTPSGHLGRLLGAPGSPSLWYPDSAIVSRVTHDLGLFTAYVALVAIEMADVASSVLGNRSGLSEQNDLVLTVLRVHGSIGFLEMKVPALIVALLIMGRSPRRLALALAVLGIAGMSYIVIDNLLLIQHAPIPH